jgi:hypothetical protein
LNIFFSSTRFLPTQIRNFLSFDCHEIRGLFRVLWTRLEIFTMFIIVPLIVALQSFYSRECDGKTIKIMKIDRLVILLNFTDK